MHKVIQNGYKIMKIDADFHKRKRNAILQQLNHNEIAIFTSSYPAWKTHDQFFPFRQDSNFYYLTGLWELTPALLIITAEGFLGSNEWLLIPRPDEVKARWDGGVETKESIQEKTGLSNLHYWDEFELKFGRMFSSQKKVLLNIPELDFSYIHHPAKTILEKIRAAFPLVSFGSANPLTSKLRQLKENHELSKIRRAIEVTGAGIEKMRQVAPTVDFEYELEAAFIHEIKRHGVKEQGYHPIIAAGKNATVLHYSENNQQLGDHDCILVDVGAEVDGYSADITRVFPKNKMNDRQAAIYEAVLRVNEKVIKAIKPGIVYQSLNDLAKELLTEEAMKLKLIQLPSEITNVYMHRVSHFLGLDVHDVGQYTQLLEPGMVVTVEPGLYINKENIGIRIEDDVLVTETGFEVLTSSVRKNLRPDFS
ncbi:MAG: aminopeptidase P family protein [Bacteroidetes bacterium]|nr:aminopeptidase P family protein [Bacteroidota bacterium]